MLHARRRRPPSTSSAPSVGSLRRDQRNPDTGVPEKRENPTPPRGSKMAHFVPTSNTATAHDIAQLLVREVLVATESPTP